MRDLCTASSSVNIVNSKIFRTGCVSKASEADINHVANELGIKVWVDLRSPAEFDEDESKNSRIYNGFEGYRFNKADKIFVSDNAIAGIHKEYQEGEEELVKKRYFVSLMSESLIKKGVFFRFKKRIRAKAIGLVALSAFSRRAGKKVRNIFIDTINNGGLSLLNELVVDASGNEIIAVMKLVADSSNYPIGLFCTAGKDRTGLIAMLTLHIVGASDDEIIADYVLSDSAYKDIKDSKAMVVAMKQVDVDPTIFLRADPAVMRATMLYLRTKFGSIDSFLDTYGFDAIWRNKLRESVKISV